MATPKSHSAFGGQAPLMLGVTWTMATIATTLVILRGIFARTHNRKLRWDLIWVVIGAIFGLACQVGITLQCLHGVGNHIVNVPIDDIWSALYLTFVGISVGLGGNTGAKLSIVALLLQITPKEIHNVRRIVLWTVGALVVTVNVVQIILLWTQCHPIAKLWDIILPGSCPGATPANNFSYFNGAVAVVTDVFLALYPTTMVWSLQLSHRTKIAFCVLMAGGLLPAVAGVVRTIYSHRLLVSTDVTHELVPFLMWSDTEMWFVMILGSLPPLRPLFDRVILRRNGGRKDNSGALGSGGIDLPATIGSAGKKGGAVVTVAPVQASPSIEAEW
ncbi:hypothetical protein K461DRAFT_271542 [Myriangium duriaei CBS 260.36]|uniref:Rhodopsin domain-containing protein n=1 Tax=Myriangium duriaei CBS 260.36 TaxID=1168546 RepID=A0A9P4IUZ6_9PEZI|nr:hypothetical protein K461DRAFT_271542 [Myriangium duriaei CBS 260.36]